jgi:FKBP-type peptidyl-prolyl cis-trans isomerase
MTPKMEKEMETKMENLKVEEKEVKNQTMEAMTAMAKEKTTVTPSQTTQQTREIKKEAMTEKPSESTLGYKQVVSTLITSPIPKYDFNRLVKMGKMTDKVARAVKIEMKRRGFSMD